MPKKFYFTTLARKPMTLSGRVIKFLISSISGGRASGVYATEDEGEIAVLDDAVRGRRGVSEIDEASYNESEKKTQSIPSLRNSNVSKPHLVRIPTLPEVSVNGKVGVAQPAADKGEGKSIFEGETHTTPSIASLLRVKTVNSPKPFTASEGKTKRASDRATRAKVRIARASVSSE